MDETSMGKPTGLKADRHWVWVFAALVMSLTTIPYLTAAAGVGPDWRFTGFLFGVDDGNSYIAKMLRGAAGDWLFRTPYTAFPQRGVLAFFPYMLLGKLVSPARDHTSLVLGFHAFRLVAGFLAILATADFLAIFLRSRFARRLGLALVVLGGGLGWALLLLGQDQWLGSLPLELYSPETFGFLSLYGLPHLSLARALLLWGLVAYLRPTSAESQMPETGQARDGWRSPGWWLYRAAPAERGPALTMGLFWFVLGLAQPLTVVVAWTVVAAHLSLHALLGAAGVDHFQKGWWGQLRRALWGIGISSPLVIYTALTFNLDPFLRLWTAQNLILSPHPAHYLLAYGLLAPLALYAAVGVVRNGEQPAGLLVGWVLLLPLLAYAPYNLQRRLPEGTWVAVVCLAMLGLERLPWGRWARLAALPLALAFPSTLILLAGGILTAGRSSTPVFRPADEIAIFESLAAQAPDGAVVLSAFETGNALPAWAPLRVVLGHGPESVNLAELEPQVTAFYRTSTPDPDRLALIEELGIGYVYWGPAERRLGDWVPGDAAYLQLLDRQGEYLAYQVVNE